MKEVGFIVCAFLGLLLIFWAGYKTGEESGFQQGYFTRNHPECDIWSKRFNEDFCQDILPMAPVGTLSWATTTSNVEVKDDKATRGYYSLKSAITSEDAIRTQTSIVRCTHSDGSVTETPIYENDSFIMHGDCTIIGNTH